MQRVTFDWTEYECEPSISGMPRRRLPIAVAAARGRMLPADADDSRTSPGDMEVAA